METYQIKSDGETVLAIDYEYKGNTYQQSEPSAESLIDLATLLSDINLDGVLDMSDAPTIKVSDVIKAFLHHKAHERFLRIVLVRKDGEEIPEDAFKARRGIDLIKFLEEVVKGFFILNKELSEHLTDSVLRMFAAGIKKVGSLSPLIARYLPSAPETSQKQKPSAKKRTKK